MKIVTKGTWYYEIQILMFVIMWQHNMAHKHRSVGGLRIGRLYIWRDMAWLHHGLPYKVVRTYRDIDRYLAKVTMNQILFWESLGAYLRLYRAGFRISCSRSDIIEINRFFWKDKVIQDMADIDCVAGHYNTIFNGTTKRLGS